MALQTATKAKTLAPPKAATKKPGKPAVAAAKPSAPKAAAPKKAQAATKTPAPKAAPKKAAETVTLKVLFETLGARHDMPKKQAHTLAAEMVELVTDILKNGNRVRMSGLGILQVTDRPERTGRNPATGAAIQIAASRKISFRVAKELKTAV